MIEGQYLQESVDQHYPGALMFDAMRVWSLPDGKENKLAEMCESGDYFGQLKKDGNWYQYVTTPQKPYLFSRTESVGTGLLTEKVDNVPHIQEALKLLPPYTIVIGEIYYPGKNTNEVRKVMGCKSPLAIKRQKGEMGWIKFFLHDIIYWNGVSLIEKGAWDRYNFLKTAFEALDLGKSGHIELAEAFTDNLFERISAALDAGEEGMVLKKKDYPYAPGKKPAWSMIKVKQVDYADVICLGFEPPTVEYSGTELETWGCWGIFKRSDFGKEDWVLHEKTTTPTYIKSPLFKTIPITKPYFNGWCGSILVGGYDNQGNKKSLGSVSSGLTDQLREQMKQNPENFIDKVCMIEMMHKFEDAFRHGIFKGFRDDKNAKECTIESIFG